MNNAGARKIAGEDGNEAEGRGERITRVGALAPTIGSI